MKIRINSVDILSSYLRAGSLLTGEVFWVLAVHVQFVPCPRKVHTQAEDRTGRQVFPERQEIQHSGEGHRFGIRLPGFEFLFQTYQLV